MHDLQIHECSKRYVAKGSLLILFELIIFHPVCKAVQSNFQLETQFNFLKTEVTELLV
jgi:hypothetical protein